MTEELYWLGFSAFPGIGPTRFHKLLVSFGTAKDAWLASEGNVEQIIGKSLSAQFIAFRKIFSLEAYAQRLAQKKISYVLIRDTNYPQLLKNIPTAPFVLYIKGDVSVVSHITKSIAIVGTRKVTQYGKDVTTLLTRDLVEQEFVIVSGLAMGVDAVAHQTTMENGGKTIAVLGCGVDCCSPSINQTIYDKIIGHFGAVVSESAFGQATSKGMFPSRNRIIAGLSLGVVVTEGAEDSGALITASNAASLHRPVFAVPGPITAALSKGPLTLIQKGAKTVVSVKDILDSLEILQKKPLSQRKLAQGENEIEQLILQMLENENLSIDELVRKMGKDSSTVISTLSVMEIKGMVRNVGGKFSV